jgi:hypothetical protein
MFYSVLTRYDFNNELAVFFLSTQSPFCLILDLAEGETCRARTLQSLRADKEEKNGAS